MRVDRRATENNCGESHCSKQLENQQCCLQGVTLSMLSMDSPMLRQKHFEGESHRGEHRREGRSQQAFKSLQTVKRAML